jgi:hypothetical protein
MTTTRMDRVNKPQTSDSKHLCDVIMEPGRGGLPAISSSDYQRA